MVRSPYFWAEEASARAKSISSKSASTHAVDVVLASDQAFLPFTAVTIGTILNNYRDRRTLRIHLLTDAPLSQEHADRFNQLQSIRSHVFNEVVVDGSSYEGLRTTPGISVATYYRLQMHELLPEDVKRVVYMDADIVVRDCVSQLFDFDLRGAVIAGVEDTISRDYVAKLGQHPETVHVNAGVLLIDIQALREIDFTSLAASFMRAKRYTLRLGDQEIVTGILGLETSAAPVAWNVHGSMFEPKWVEKYVGHRNGMDPLEAVEAIRNPSLIHYTYRRKPWIAPEHPRASDWFKAAAMTAYRFDPGE